MSFEKEVVERLTRIEAGQKYTHDTLGEYKEKTDQLIVKMAVVETKVGSPKKVAAGVSAGVSSIAAIIGGVVVFVINRLKGE